MGLVIMRKSVLIEVTFDELQGHILDDQGEVVVLVSKMGSLYYHNCEPLTEPQINAVSNSANEKLWHRRTWFSE